MQRADGTERIVESRVAFLREDGQRVAMVSIVRDITDRKHAEQRLREQTETLDTINRLGARTDR